MATPTKTPVPSAPSAGISPTSIADAGAGLIRLWVTAITLPLTTANAIGAGVTRLITSVTATLDGNAASQSGNELVQATSDLVKATTGLYLSLLNAAIGGLEATTRAVNTAVTEATTPRK
jgi:hypothetical protein